ncbi:MAG: hypothetical protein QOJ99_2343 [Bryobacterales bacterium]|nr:hypothetical protein [Bryobacterales bacterium]
MSKFTLLLLLAVPAAYAQTAGELAAGYLRDLIRLDSSNPPGNESRVAQYLKQVADREGIPADLVGDNPQRLNFIARVQGSGKRRPLLLMAHSDVVPADRAQWTVDPFAAVEKGGYIYGRGAEDDKDLLAAELAVLVDQARRQRAGGAKFDRDLILLSEADEEAGSAGAKWVIGHAWPKIEAEFALNEFSYILTASSGVPVFQIQTAEKIPTRIKLTAHGTAGHGSLPREDNPVYHLSRAIVRLTEAEQPVKLNATTRAYFSEISKLPDYAWLAPLLPRLEDPGTSAKTATEIGKRDPDFGAMLHFSLSPTMLNAGVKINVIPNVAEAQMDGRRLPGETAEEVFARLRQIVDDPAVSVEPAEAGKQPPTEPSSLTSPLYVAMQNVFKEAAPNAVVVPFLMRATTDGAYLRAKGMAVYGVPIFRKDGEIRMHGNDERMAVENLRSGTELLKKIVARVAAGQ